jgi:MarR family transcriptional regulator, organic hydroperoxide resistance regulator
MSANRTSILRVDTIIRVRNMVHVTRSSLETPAPVGQPRPRDGDLVEAIVTEVLGSVGELRCAAMGRLVRQHLSMTQLHVLWLLEHHGAMTMSRLAELLDVSLSSATGLIDRMDEHGLIERVRVPDDRRLVLVQPTDGGRRALEESAETRRERLRAVAERLAPASRSAILRAFRDFRAALQAELDPEHDHQHHFARPAD